MTIESSRFLLLKIGDGASPEVFTDLGAQANGRIGLSGQRIQTSNKTTQNWNTSIAGLRDFIVDCDGFADWPDTNGLDSLITEALAGNDFSVEAHYASTPSKFTATVQATRLELDGPNQNATQYRTTVELSQGAPVQT